MLGVTGCRDNGTLTPADLSMAGGGGGGGGTSGGDMATTNYMVSTIAAMRANGPNPYELDDVIAIGVNPGGTRLYVQDAGGGDFSAIKANCPGSGSHMCTVGSTVKTVAVGHKVTLKGTYIKGKIANGGTEDFYIDSITDNGVGTLPPVQTVALTDVQQSSLAMALMGTGAANKKWWYQHVTVTAPGTLGMYDLSPAAFKYTGGTGGCPAQFGWGIAPAATSGANPTLSCASTCSTNPVGAGCTQPAAVALNPDEVLIGTDFFSGFKESSDCACASKYTDTLVTMSSTTSKLGGILIYDTVFGATPVQPFIYLAPLDNANDVTFN